MRVGNYAVSWRYTSIYNRQYDHDVEHTTCKIVNVENQKIVSEESVQKYHLDTHCNDKVRKASLRKALLASFPNVEERQAFYNAYRLMTPEEPRWHTKEEKQQIKEQRKAERLAKLAH